MIFMHILDGSWQRTEFHTELEWKNYSHFGYSCQGLVDRERTIITYLIFLIFSPGNKEL